jgi:hypothetical protein
MTAASGSYIQSSVTPLKDRIQDALDESGMLIPGAEILVGFYRVTHLMVLLSLPRSLSEYAAILLSYCSK